LILPTSAATEGEVKAPGPPLRLGGWVMSAPSSITRGGCPLSLRKQAGALRKVVGWRSATHQKVGSGQETGGNVQWGSMGWPN
jgi:hypothetical protein